MNNKQPLCETGAYCKVWQREVIMVAEIVQYSRSIEQLMDVLQSQMKHGFVREVIYEMFHI